MNVFGNFSLWEPTGMHCVSGTVNMHSFVWKFLCAICKFSFTHDDSKLLATW